METYRPSRLRRLAASGLIALSLAGCEKESSPPPSTQSNCEIITDQRLRELLMCASTTTSTIELSQQLKEQLCEAMFKEAGINYERSDYCGEEYWKDKDGNGYLDWFDAYNNDLINKIILEGYMNTELIRQSIRDSYDSLSDAYGSVVERDTDADGIPDFTDAYPDYYMPDPNPIP